MGLLYKLQSHGLQETRLHQGQVIVSVKRAAMTLSWTTPEIAARTNNDWSNNRSIFRPGGATAWIEGRTALTQDGPDPLDSPVFPG